MDSLPPLSQLTLDDSTPTSYNPALALSEEAQDLILQQFDGTNNERYARANRRSFARVHRSWKSAGDRALYRKPFELSVHWDFTAAKNLLDTLGDRPDLAIAVRELVGLPEAIRSIYFAGKEESEGRVVIKSEALLERYMVELIRLCTNLTVLSRFVRDLAVILKKHKDLEEVRIESMPLFRLTPELYSQWTTACRTPSIKRLFLDDFNVKFWTDFPSSVDLATPVPSLSIVSRVVSTQIRLRIIPDPSVLTHFSLFHAFLSIADFDLLFRRLSTVQHLSLKFPKDDLADKITVRRYLEGRHRRHRGIPLPSFNFTPFPSIQSLAFHNCQEMTLEKLRSIGTDAPNLVKLELGRTFWSITHATVESWPEGFAQVIRNYFPKLKRMDVGVLPYEGVLFPRDFVEAMVVQGVKFTWMLCRTDPRDAPILP